MNVSSPGTAGRRARSRLAITAVAAAGLAAGFAICMNVVHYRTWALVPSVAFQPFQNASALHTIPAAALIGGGSLACTVIVARRGLPGTSQALLWAAAALAAMPLLVTPAVFVSLQGALAQAGPTPELVERLVGADLALRAIPPVLQLLILCLALLRVTSAPAGDGTGRGDVRAAGASAARPEVPSGRPHDWS